MAFTCNRHHQGDFPHMSNATTALASPSPPTSHIHIHTSPCRDISDPHLGLSMITHLDVASRAISPCLSDVSDTKTFYSTIEVTEITVNGGTSATASDEISTDPSLIRTNTKEVGTMQDSQDRVDTSTAIHTPEKPISRKTSTRPTSKRKRTVSRGSSVSNSPGDPRSTSRSTTARSRPVSRRESPYSHRRVPTNSSLVSHPNVRSDGASSQKRRESLLALHRESCRLFQEPQATSRTGRPSNPPTPTSPTFPASMHDGYHTPSDLGSPVTSPLRLPPLPSGDRSSSLDEHSENESVGRSPVYQPSNPDSVVDGSPKQAPATVIDWTSPSTRRREYAKIDRASRGVRGFWRKVAPKWCRSGDSRMPFFEQGKDGKGNYEGSVRRFRMDLPDEPEQVGAGREKRSGKSAVTTIKGDVRGTKTGSAGRRWLRIGVQKGA